MNYRPLKRDEIRVVRLLPSPDIDAQVRCEIEYRTHAFDYSALSYVWGDPNPPKKILVGKGREVSITPNLYAALRRLRDANEVVDIWIDSLCINQEDAAEKQVQAGKMNLIYSQAEKVFVWLGEEAEDSELAMDLVNHISTIKKNTVALTTDTSLDPSWSALNRIFQRPYWTRAWTFQEITATHNAILCCGPSRARFRPLTTLLRAVMPFNGYFTGQFGYLVMVGLEPFVNPLVGAYERIQGVRVTDEKLSILECLIYLRNRQATDSRDKVYAATQLAKASDFDAAYDKSLPAVFAEIVEFTIKYEGNLDILSAYKTRGLSQPISQYMGHLQDVKLLREGIKIMDCDVQARDKYTSGDVGWFQFMAGLLQNMWKTAPEADQNQPDAELRSRWEELSKTDNGLKGSVKRIADELLPSWAPDWTHTCIQNAYLFLSTSTECYYRASKDSKPVVEFTTDEGLVTLEGIRLDTIKAVTYSETGSETDKDLPEEWSVWDQGDQPRDIYGGKTLQQAAFLCTVMLGKNKDGSKGNHGLSAKFVNERYNLRFTDDGNNEESISQEDFIPFRICHEYFYFAMTHRGYMGRVPRQTEPGDVVVVFLGARVPHVPRKYPKTDAYYLVGECYVHGVMEGEVIEELETGQKHLENFTLI